jgi:hypothetical protein
MPHYGAMAVEERFRGFLTMQSRGVLALPPEVRRRWHLDRPGAQVELVEREDGVLELRPHVPVPATEAWFWDARWHAGEIEVDEHVAAGRVREFAGPDEFLESLDES